METNYHLIILLVEWAIRVVMMIVVPARRSPTAAKVWLLLIFFEPVLGLLVFLIFGSSKTPRWRRLQLLKLPEVLKPLRASLKSDPNLFSGPIETEFADSVRLAQRLGSLPLLGKNSVEVLTIYSQSIDRLVDDINRAKSSVHLVYYIFYPDSTGKMVAAALTAAAKRGVECRLLLDAVGSRKALGKMARELRKNGVQVVDILPFGFFRKRAARFDLRNHRKIAVIDGCIAYVGSQNIINSKHFEGLVYQELVTRVTGPAVWQLQYLFISDWYLENDELLDNLKYFPNPTTGGTVALQTLPSGPDYSFQNNEMVLLSLFHAAKKRICLVTPYFIPDDPILSALETAAVRGVEVILIVSEKADNLVVNLAQRSYYERVLEAGIKVYQYKKKFLHAKHVTVDYRMMTVGSYNIDIRSFTLNAELMLLAYDQNLAQKIVDIEISYLSLCEELTLEQWQKRSLIVKTGENFARLFSPLL